MRLRFDDRVPSGESMITFSLFFCVLALVYYHTLFFGVRIPRDSGAFLTIADTIRTGQTPYLHLVDHKPPGIFYTLAGALSIHRSVLAARIVLFLTNTGTAAVLVLIGYHWHTVRAGLVAAGIYLGAILLYQGMWILTEQFVAFWSVIALFAVIVAFQRSSNRLLIGAGCAAGIACLYKQTGVLTVAAVGLYLTLDSTDWRRIDFQAVSWERIGFFSLGVLLPLLFTAIHFALQGAFSELVYWTLSANQSYAVTDFGTTVDRIRWQIQQARSVWLAAVAGLAVTLVRRDSHLRMLGTFLFVLSFFPLLIRQYGHYFIQILPFAALLGALFLEDTIALVRRHFPDECSPAWAVALVFAVALLVSTPFITSVATQHGAKTGFTLADQQQIAEEIQQLSDSDERILVVTAEPQYYFLADRLSADGTNVYYLPINRGVSYTSEGVIHQIESDPPAVVVLRGCDRSPEICSSVKAQYSQQSTHPRGISLWTPNSTSSNSTDRDS